MGGMGLVILAIHFFRVSVIGSDEESVAGFFTGFKDESDGLVCCFDALDGGLVYSSLVFL